MIPAKRIVSFHSNMHFNFQGGQITPAANNQPELKIETAGKPKVADKKKK